MLGASVDASADAGADEDVSRVAVSAMVNIHNDCFFDSSS